MMTRFSIFIILCFCLFSVLSLNAAAATPDVSLTVKDSKTKAPIEYATVELRTETDSLIAGGITDAKGYLSLPCTADSCKIRIRYIGYKTYEASVKNRDLGNIFLEEDAQLLEEVSITGKAHTAKIDRDVYVITKEIKAGTTSARELLGKLNGVMYNPYDQSIAVNGDKNILILIDGIEKDQQMAKTLSPERIDRVEVIKEPVGKYAADGYRAVINIITKKDFAGVDINAYFNSMFNFTNKGYSPFIREEEGVNVLYTYKKMNLYGNCYGNYNTFHLPTEYTRQYGNLLVSTPAMDTNHPNGISTRNSGNFTLGGDYLFRPDNTLSLELNYNTGYDKNIMSYDLTSYLNQTPVGESQSTSTGRSTNDALRATLTYKGKWSEKSSVEANFRYLHSMPTNHSAYMQDAWSSFSHGAQTGNYYRLNLDYIYQFSSTFSMDLGYGNIIDRNTLHQNDSILHQKQLRNRVSLYFSWAPFQKLNMKIGGIVEFFHQTYQGISQTHTVPMPYANIQYKPSNKFSMTAKYHAWTPNYPDISQLSPIGAQLDSLTWMIGNPSLKLSNSQEVSLEFNILQIFRIEPYYDFDLSSIQQYVWENKGQYYQSNVNASKYEKYGVSVSFTLPIKNALFWQNWFNANVTHIAYGAVSSRRSNVNFNSILYYNMMKWDGGAGVGIQKQMYKNPMLQGYNLWNNDALLVIIQKNFFKKRLNCSFIYIPPVNFLSYEQGDYINTPTYKNSSTYGVGVLKNLMLLQINYRFTSGKQVSIKKSSLDNEPVAPKKSGGIGL